jgi:N-acetylglutamate synthase-like GNAT family acetyltransferase
MPDEPQAAYEIGEATAGDVRPLRSRYLRPDQPEEAVVYRSDEADGARHFAARAPDGRIMGVASLFCEDRVAGMAPFGRPGMRLRGLAVEDDCRSQGIGTAMVAHLLEVGREAGIAEAWATAPLQNLRFFRRNKFTTMSSEFDVLGFGSHKVVARTL